MQDYYGTTNIFQQITVEFYSQELFHIKQFAIYSSVILEIDTEEMKQHYHVFMCIAT